MVGMMIEAMERGIVPDRAIRFGIRRLCRERLKSLPGDDSEHVSLLRNSPLAVHTREANEQHYELPPEFFSLVLGKNRKYSSAFWGSDCKNLDQAEDDALRITMERAELVDGMQILELGCGWGSLTLAMAKKFPRSKIVALSNSNPQRIYIENELKKHGLTHVTVLTRNIVDTLDLDREFGKFDRVVSVEMFEHLRNYETLFERISSWLKPDGKLFFHVFAHRSASYLFETEGNDNWMGKYFFTGGQMPAHGLFLNFQKHLVFEKEWWWSGEHYGKTAEAWLEKMDQNQVPILQIMKQVYGPKFVSRWFRRWRVFFMACAELFHYQNGREWGVSHYLFRKSEC
jgi:cyclopropane-fatty-acyl-phospholipid synthase